MFQFVHLSCSQAKLDHLMAQENCGMYCATCSNLQQNLLLTQALCTIAMSFRLNHRKRSRLLAILFAHLTFHIFFFSSPDSFFTTWLSVPISSKSFPSPFKDLYGTFAANNHQKHTKQMRLPGLHNQNKAVYPKNCCIDGLH